MVQEALEVVEDVLEEAVEKLSLSEQPSDGKKNEKKKFYKKRFFTYKRKQKAYEEEERNNTKTILKEGLTGTVKWYSLLKNYGFITQEDGSDVFVHQSAIKKSMTVKPYLRSLAAGEQVEFSLVQGKEGFEAINVTGPDGGCVRGDVQAVQFLMNKRRRMYGSSYRRKDLNNGKKDDTDTPPTEKSSIEESQQTGADKQNDGDKKNKNNTKPKKRNGRQINNDRKDSTTLAEERQVQKPTSVPDAGPSST